MQTLFEIGFVLAMILPPAAVIAGALTLVLAARRSRAAKPAPTRRAA